MKPKSFPVTKKLLNILDSDTKKFISELMDWASQGKTVRITYTPKVTNGKKVQRTIEPYSLRLRNIHVNGKFPDNYKKPSKPTVVLFGYDIVEKSIKMFVCDRIVNYEFKGREFKPRWPVEYSSNKIDNKKSKGVKESSDLIHSTMNEAFSKFIFESFNGDLDIEEVLAELRAYLEGDFDDEMVSRSNR